MPGARKRRSEPDHDILEVIGRLAEDEKLLFALLARFSDPEHEARSLLTSIIQRKKLLQDFLRTFEQTKEVLELTRAVSEESDRFISFAADKERRKALSIDVETGFRKLAEVLETVRSHEGPALPLDDSDPISTDDFLWDTGSSFSLERIAGDLTTTRGATVIKGGIVHRKGAQPAFRCPRCGGELKRATANMRFLYAPAESAEQTVPGFVCECGQDWPDPRSVRNAHEAAFKA